MLKYLSNYTLSHKKSVPFDMIVLVIEHMFQLQFMIEKPQLDVLTLSTTFYDLSISCNFFAKAESVRNRLVKYRSDDEMVREI